MGKEDEGKERTTIQSMVVRISKAEFLQRLQYHEVHGSAWPYDCDMKACDLREVRILRWPDAVELVFSKEQK